MNYDVDTESQEQYQLELLEQENITVPHEATAAELEGIKDQVQTIIEVEQADATTLTLMKDIVDDSSAPDLAQATESINTWAKLLRRPIHAPSRETIDAKPEAALAFTKQTIDSALSNLAKRKVGLESIIEDLTGRIKKAKENEIDNSVEVDIPEKGKDPAVAEQEDQEAKEPVQEIKEDVQEQIDASKEEGQEEGQEAVEQDEALAEAQTDEQETSDQEGQTTEQATDSEDTSQEAPETEPESVEQEEESQRVVVTLESLRDKIKSGKVNDSFVDVILSNISSRTGLTPVKSTSRESIVRPSASSSLRRVESMLESVKK